MNQKALFDKVSFKASKITAMNYSTSFSLGIKMLPKEQQLGINAIYGFTRFADEIVDTFHDYNKRALLEKFEADTYQAIEDGISMNPILNSFQATVNKYNIDHELIDTFLNSMKSDLQDKEFDRQAFDEYILGSAEVVGLMCLKVFINGDDNRYKALKPYAMHLGAAFQKVNFLRDLESDFENLGRTYFPGIAFHQLSDEHKSGIEKEIRTDFTEAFKGILMLPKESRLGVYLAYVYYKRLFEKISLLPAQTIKEGRVRISNPFKLALLFQSVIRHQLNIL